MLVNAGIIDHADPIRNLYKINPALSPTSERASVIYATVLGVGGSFEKVKHIPTYEVGDCVLYVCDEDSSKHKVSAWAIILGTYPGGLETNVFDISLLDNKEAGPLYEGLTKILGYSKDFDKRGFLHGWSKFSKGTDYVIGSSNITFNLSEYELYLRSKHAGIYLNSTTHELTDFGVTHNSEFLNKSVKSIIVNNIPYEHTRHSNHLNVNSDKNFFGRSTLNSNLFKDGNNADRVISRYEQNSPLVGCYRSTVLSNDTPISLVEINDDGLFKFTGLNGFIIDKGVDIPFVCPSYEDSILSDDSLSEKSDIIKSGNIPSNWLYLNANKNDNTSWKSVLDVNKTAEVTKIEGVSCTKAKARIAALPDGSIVFRDAWGSEIRMKDGDIQLSAANKITLLSGTDILNIAGGVHSTNAVKGVQLGSAEGCIDLAGSSVTLNAAEQLTLNSEGLINAFGKDISVDGDRCTIDTDDLLLHGRYHCTISSSNASILGDNRALIKSGNSIIDVKSGVIAISTYQVSLYSNIKIDKGTYNSGKLVDGSVAYSNTGDKYVYLNGNLLLDGCIHANKNISSSALIAAREMAAKNTGWNGGIYGLKKKPKEIEIDKKDIKNANMSNITFSERISRYFAASAVFAKNRFDKAMRSIFTLGSKGISIFKPAFNTLNDGALTQATSLASASKNKMKPTIVDISGEKRYIYPGVFFWKNSGLKTQMPLDVEDLNISVTSYFSGVNSL